MGLHEWDAVVIGGGAAGLSAAQMLGRAGRRTLVVDGGAPRNRFATHMHGVLGHDGRSPLELLARGRDEVQAYGVEIATGGVSRLHDDGGVVRVVLDDGTAHDARAVVIATGVRDELPAVPGLRELWGRGILHCPYCHGWEVRGARLGVLTTGPASAHQLELVRQWSDDVTAFTAAVEPLGPALAERLSARGIRVVSSPVAAVLGDPLTAVETVDGERHEIDALFTAPEPRIDLAFAEGFDLERAEEPGAPLVVDMRGATSHPRIFAAGNVVLPYANVPVSMGAGSMAGAAVNGFLVMEDAEFAVRTARRVAHDAAWEQRYADSDRSWSGRVNATFAAVAADLEPGRALDVGCGEGADVVWLAAHGWTATGVDVSPTALTRATAAADERGVDATFALAGDALPDGPFDLVSASFLHSWDPDFPRWEILREAASRVAHGGHLLVVSHAAPPSWVDALPEGAPPMLPPDAELALLDLDPHEWTPLLVELRHRPTTDPQGEPGTHADGVLLLQRR